MQQDADVLELAGRIVEEALRCFVPATIALSDVIEAAARRASVIRAQRPVCIETLVDWDGRFGRWAFTDPDGSHAGTLQVEMVAGSYRAALALVALAYPRFIETSIGFEVTT